MPSVLSIPKDMLRRESGNALLKVESAPGKHRTFVCQFNPDQFRIHADGNFYQIKRRESDSPIMQFMGRSSPVLEVKLFFDTSTSYEISSGNKNKPTKHEPEDVSAYTNSLLSLVCIEGKVHRPPMVTFQWGSFEACGFAEHVDVNFIMFEAGGKPVRAEVLLKLVGVDITDAGAGKSSPRESSDRSKCVVFTSDSSLWDIAQREYGDAGGWREIARENHIMNPLEVAIGTHLKIPPSGS